MFRCSDDGTDLSEAKWLKALEDENAKLEKLLAEQAFDAAALRELLSKNWLVRGQARPMEQARLPTGRLGLQVRYRELASECRRFLYPRLFILPGVRGAIRGSRMHRLYPEEGPAVRKCRSRRKDGGVHVPILVEAKPHARW